MSQSADPDELLGLLGPWRERAGPLATKVADALDELILQGAIEPGVRLPAERQLALSLGVSRGTAVAAYQALAERRRVARRRGSGTVVAGTAAPSGVRAHRNPQFSRFVSTPGHAIDLTIGAPYPNALVRGLAGSIGGALEAGTPGKGYAPLGLPALRAGIAERMASAGGPCEAEDILVTHGAQGAIGLLTSALVRRGDRIIVEAPTYAGAIELFSRAGASVVGVARDESGPIVSELERALLPPTPALVFLIPTCHNPTGTVMSLARRREVLELCARHGVPVVEDTITADLLFDGASPPPLWTLAPDQVIAIGSFSKTVWGGLRTGWIRAASGLALRLGRIRTALDLGGGMIDQAVALRSLPLLDQIFELRRDEARQGHRLLVSLLAERLPSWEVTPCRGGYSVWARLPGTSAEEFAATALTHGVAIAPGGACAPEDRFLDHVRMCFADEPSVLEEAVERLERAWAETEPRAAMQAGTFPG